MSLSPTGRVVLRGAQALALVALVAYTVQAAIPAVCGSSTHDFFEIWVYNLLIGAAAVFCLARAVFYSAERLAWVALGVGLLSWAAGEAYFSLFLSDLGEPPLPSVSDALWLAFYPACYVAIVLLVRERVREFRSSLWLDGLVGALAAAAIAADLVFGALVGHGRESATVAVDLSYALGDLLLLGFVVAVCGLTGWRPGRGLGMVGAGLVASAIVDGYFLYESATGGTVDSTLMASLWPASTLLIGFAAWQRPTVSEPIRFEGWRVLVMPSAFAVSGLALLAYQTVKPQNMLALVLAIATLAAVIVRMAVTFRENIRLLSASRLEALTDVLTGLGNRRKLMLDLEAALKGAVNADGTPPRETIGLVLLDLDGFKQYNDRFGHPVGDALLTSLGQRLERVVGARGLVYRLGGDEFCVIAPGHEAGIEAIARMAKEALSETGQGFHVGCSRGTAVLPRDGADVTTALRIADERLYTQKDRHQRSAVGTQTSAALLQALEEREPELRDHLDEVAQLSVRVGRKLGLSGEELEDVARAAHLHDVGKVAVPDAILQKPGSLDPVEWELMRQHTVAGERILNAAPALASVAGLVRSSHERYDGEGYPDGIAGEHIPIGARIITACDAYNSMISNRPYGRAIDREAALEELRRCVGHQFDPAVVEMLCELCGPAGETASKPATHSADALSVAASVAGAASS
jgi:two-component system cell cycle response regulator